MNYILETEKVALRQFTVDDLEMLFQLNNEPKILRWQPASKNDREKIINDINKYKSYYKKYKNFGIWAIVDKTGGQLIGRFMFLPHKEQPWFNPELCSIDDIEIGFCLHPEFWGQGIAAEIACLVTRKGFTEYGVSHVIGMCFSDNLSSIRVMEKIGMKLENKFLYDQLESIQQDAQEVVVYGLNLDDFVT